MGTERQAEIDGLRAIAIGLVVGYHYFQPQFPSGYLGVDIFFVISGFLITRQILMLQLAESFSVTHFFARRILRILPALLSVMLVFGVLGWWVLLPEEFDQLGLHIFGGTFLISNFIFWKGTGYFDPLAGSKPMFHLWSLSIEEQFYLFWPFALVLLKKLNRLKWEFIALATTLSFALNFWIHSPTARFYFPLCRFWEIFIGATLAIYSLNKSPLRQFHGNILSAVGALMVFLPSLSQLPAIGDRLFSQLLVCTGTALIIASGPQSGLNKRLLANSAVGSIGLLSYGIYLWHWPLLVFGRLLISNFGPEAKFALILFTVLISAVSYYSFEWPIRQIKRTQYKFAIYVILAFALCIGLLGLGVTATDGNFVRMAIPSEDKTNFTETKKMKIDFSMAQLESCEFITGSEDRQSWCSLGNKPDAAPNLIIAGDSFSPYFGNLIDSYILQTRRPDLIYRTVSFGQCPLLLGFGSEDCRHLAAKTLDYLRRQTSVKVVVLVANWRAYAGESEPSGDNEKDHQFQLALEKTIDALHQLKLQVLISYSPPPGRSPLYCLKRFGRFESQGACFNPIKYVQDDERSYREILDSFIKSRNLPFFDPSTYLCNQEACMVHTEGKYLYYSDGLHLNPEGSVYLEAKARNDLNKVFQSLDWSSPRATPPQSH